MIAIGDLKLEIQAAGLTELVVAGVPAAGHEDRLRGEVVAAFAETLADSSPSAAAAACLGVAFFVAFGAARFALLSAALGGEATSLVPVSWLRAARTIACGSVKSGCLAPSTLLALVSGLLITVPPLPL